MKKTDIKWETPHRSIEYSDTAPLAYGVEPHTTARKIRFTGTAPSIVVVDCRVNPDPEAKGIQRWSEIGHRIEPRYNLGEYENSPYEACRKAAERGETEFTYANKFETGSIPAEVWRENKEEWVPTVIRPAAVHRTWAEHEARTADRKAREEQARMERAPYNLHTAVREAMDAARLISPDTPVSTVIDEISRHVKRPITWGYTR